MCILCKLDFHTSKFKFYIYIYIFSYIVGYNHWWHAIIPCVIFGMCSKDLCHLRLCLWMICVCLCVQTFGSLQEETLRSDQRWLGICCTTGGKYPDMSGFELRAGTAGSWPSACMLGLSASGSQAAKRSAKTTQINQHCQISDCTRVI